ncbi:peptidoglycan DD-metalloendopeptidase family protein [Litoribacter alkaliphilus]|uniref:Peptidoglycan DD-metalloendopeptidase family protein n=1 Tax=Litoribacter ruber TaxID=702568 RepID=A0AAP2CFF7_9BACT|nr:peptidoglycan DD-metalloendopeptidase family protein [Litoribacter alkaliphilus]MBS9523578.1 peptidoglycan DD-metalloendopeptidase family protein [Litoribacter alkaliphilus]
MDYKEFFKRQQAHPLMGEALNKDNTELLDLTANNKGLEGVNLQDTSDFDKFIKRQLNGKKYGLGGYMEKRDIYRRSDVFAQNDAFRNIHLGVDIWAEACTPVYAPFDGVVHSFRDNAGYGNYGPTIILQHELEGQTFFTLYGHLKLRDLNPLHRGLKIKKGQLLCHLGIQEENGNWPPHLHFQIMTDMLDFDGDFPGVSAEVDTEHYRTICLDPDMILCFEVQQEAGKQKPTQGVVI